MAYGPLGIMAFLMYLTAPAGTPLVQTIVATSEDSGQPWRYVLEEPSGNWFDNDFDDSSWQQGRGGFGTTNTPRAMVNTEWTTSDIWLRRAFSLSEVPKNPSLRIHHDEDARIYLNGRLIAEFKGYSTHYVTVEMEERAADALRTGRNVLAVHCHQTGGGQCIDVGIESVRRWNRSRTWNWYERHGWRCGFNYIPATAISYTEMWMDYCFDPNRIDAELALAEHTGFNCLRVVLPYVVWEHEPEAFKQRLLSFLALCEKHQIQVVVSLFDDCVFGPIFDPVFARQPAVVPGWYANGWTPSPGHGMVRDRTRWPQLELYVRDVMETLRNDRRVLCWDLYNEPTNGGVGDVSIDLVEQVFRWARQVDPAQPLTVGLWNGNARLNDVVIRYSDIITFHNYENAETLLSHIQSLQQYHRPLICTEWLNRPRGSRVCSHLPVFLAHDVGCLHWGLVNGKTQTHLPWGHRPGDPEPTVWQHDLYHSDFRPYDKAELDLFRDLIKQSKPGIPPVG
ncbi:MAG: cellulase family glycosylhydrolase [Sedimentisphaerales bacterium]|nr:cellulase family glycosylhydrolase [Sedimentisphaerales bacterium]